MIDNNLCKAHSGFVSDIETLEGNVSRLWEKWDGMQKMVIGTLISTALSLIGVVLLLIKSL